MEVNHERLPSFAAYDLVAARSANSAKEGPQFIDCFRPVTTTAVPAPPVPPPSGPRTSDVEPPQAEAEPVDAAARNDDATEDERDEDEGAVDAQAIPVATAPVPVDDEVALDITAEPGDVAVVGVEVNGTAVVAPATESPALETSDALLPSAEEAAIATAVPEELLEPEVAAGADQLSTTKQAFADKRKASKMLPTALEAERDAAVPEKAISETNETISMAEPLEESTTVALPEISPLESTFSEDSRPDTTAKGAATAAAEAKATVAAVELATQPTSSEPAASPIQTAVNPAVGATAVAAPKAPAVLLKGKASSADAARPAGEFDPARFLSRVVKAFESAQQRGSEVRLRLHPVELGALSIEVKIHDSVLTASVQAETPEAKAAIIDNLPALRERLAEQGIRIDQFDVDLMDHSDRRQQSLDEQDSRQEERPPANPRSAARRMLNSEQPVASTARHRAAGPGGLNVII